MCSVSGFLRGIIPRAVQRKGSDPRPVEAVSSTNALENSPIRGITKLPQDMMDDMLSFLDQLIQKETNPKRRENIQRCKEFVKEHCWPPYPALLGRKEGHYDLQISIRILLL